MKRNLEVGYEHDHGRKLDIEHPVLFTEKLQWYKVNYYTPDQTRAVDKYLFKAYIQGKIGEGHTIPCYGAWETIDGLKRAWASLPETFVLKSTLQSDGRNIKIIKHKSQVDLSDILKEVKEWLKVKNTLINSYCCAYYHATPRVLAEEYVETIADQLFDYKFFCFDGKPVCIYVAYDHFKNGENSNDYPISFYDLNWNRLDVRYGQHQVSDMQKPGHFDEMVDIASRLSKDFPFVRVDFFDTPDALYVAELTFYPGGGNTEYHPLEFDKALGDLFILPQSNVRC